MSCGTCGIQASDTMQGDTGVPAGAPTTRREPGSGGAQARPPKCRYCGGPIPPTGPAACANPGCGQAVVACHCPQPQPVRYGRFSPPAWVCGICGKNLTVRVECGEVARPAESGDPEVRYSLG